MILYIHQTAQDLGWFLHIYGHILPDQIMYSRRECARCTVPKEDCLRNGFSDISAYIHKWAAFGLIGKSCRPISIILIQPFKLQVNKFVQPVIRFPVGPLPLSPFKATECQYVTNSTKLLPWGKYRCWKGYYSWRRNVDLVVRMGSMGSGSSDRVPVGSLPENWILVCPWNGLSCLTALKACSLTLRTALFTRKRGKRKGGGLSFLL